MVQSMNHERNTDLLRKSFAFLFFCLTFVLILACSAENGWSRFLKIQYHNTSNEIQPGGLWVKVNNKGLMMQSAGLQVSGNMIKGSLDVNFNSACKDRAGNSYVIDSTQGYSSMHEVDLRGFAKKQLYKSCLTTNDFQFQNIPLASIANLQRQCDINDGNTSLYTINIVVGGGTTASEGTRLVFDKNVPVIEVRCSDDYQAFKRPASVRVGEFRYVCGENYVIQGTQQWYVTSPYSTDPKCVRPEDSNNYPVIHDKPRPGADGNDQKG